MFDLAPVQQDGLICSSVASTMAVPKFGITQPKLLSENFNSIYLQRNQFICSQGLDSDRGDHTVLKSPERKQG